MAVCESHWKLKCLSMDLKAMEKSIHTRSTEKCLGDTGPYSVIVLLLFFNSRLRKHKLDFRDWQFYQNRNDCSGKCYSGNWGWDFALGGIPLLLSWRPFLKFCGGRKQQPRLSYVKNARPAVSSSVPSGDVAGENADSSLQPFCTLRA